MRTHLKEGEIKVLEIRQHWFVLIAPVLYTLVFSMITTIAISKSDSEYKYYMFIIVLISVLWLIYKFISRRTNLWIVTNHRAIDEWGVFSKNSIETPLDKVNNVTLIQPLLGRIFNYGHVEIQSAAESGSTYNRMLEKPSLLKDTITEYQEKYKDAYIRKHAESLYQATGGNKVGNLGNIVDEMERLSKLLESGAINQDEFEKVKKKLLGN